MEKHLEQFQPDEFDLIIVDEFHHASADSYKRALEYFQPRFLLGITAHLIEMIIKMFMPFAMETWPSD